MSKPLLCSQILSALTQPKRGLAMYQGGRIADIKIREKQNELVDAKKFVLDPNMIRNAWQLSLSKPSVLLEMYEYAKLPFDNVWIEWDEQFRQSIMQDHLKNSGKKLSPIQEYPDTVGYHIKKFKNKLDEEYFLYENWWFTGSGSSPHLQEKYFTPTMCYSMGDLDINWQDELARIDLLDELPKLGRCQDEEDLKVQAFAVGTNLLGRNYSFDYIPKKFLISLEQKQKLGDNDAYVNYIKKMIRYKNNHEFNCFKQLCYTISLAQSSAMHWSIPSWKFQEGYNVEEMKQHEANAMLVLEGDARFLVSLLSLINQSQHTQELVVPDKKIIHTKFGRRVPRNEYYTLNLKVSDTKIKRIYKDTFTGKGNPKREHDRRGHFRHLRDKDGNLKKKIWIKDQTVGNAELGRIDKDYKIT